MFYLYYGLILVWTLRHLRKAAKQTGEQMKVVGRILVAWGDEATPRWSRELFSKCHQREVEIHFSGKTYCGTVQVVYQGFHENEHFIYLVLNDIVFQEGFSLPYELGEPMEFKLVAQGDPVFIEEGGYSCVWAGFKGGHFAVYFSKQPQSHRCFN